MLLAERPLRASLLSAVWVVVFEADERSQRVICGPGSWKERKNRFQRNLFENLMTLWGFYILSVAFYDFSFVTFLKALVSMNAADVEFTRILSLFFSFVGPNTMTFVCRLNFSFHFDSLSWLEFKLFAFGGRGWKTVDVFALFEGNVTRSKKRNFSIKFSEVSRLDAEQWLGCNFYHPTTPEVLESYLLHENSIRRTKF